MQEIERVMLIFIRKKENHFLALLRAIGLLNYMISFWNWLDVAAWIQLVWWPYLPNFAFLFVEIWMNAFLKNPWNRFSQGICLAEQKLQLTIIHIEVSILMPPLSLPCNFLELIAITTFSMFWSLGSKEQISHVNSITKILDKLGNWRILERELFYSTFCKWIWSLPPEDVENRDSARWKARPPRFETRDGWNPNYHEVNDVLSSNIWWQALFCLGLVSVYWERVEIVLLVGVIFLIKC